MKILMTTFTYPPNKDGVAEACRMLAEGLADLKHEVWIATSMGTENNPLGERFQEHEGVKIVSFDLDRKPLKSPALVPEIGNFRQFVSRGNFDVIISQCWDPRLTRYILPLLPTLKAKRVMVSHGYGKQCYVWHPGVTLGLIQWLRGLIFTAKNLPRMIRLYDKLVFLSTKKDFGRYFDHLLADWLRHPGIEVIANGINLNQFPETAGDLRTQQGAGDGPLALCVANYGERKNQRLAVEIFRKANVSGSVLVFIGSEMNEFGFRALEFDKQLADIYRECRVLFLEKLSREETFRWFVACDFFLLTAKTETQPIVLIEAMAAGKPWISTDTGCVSEMPGGIICRRKSELIEGVRTLSKDTALRTKLGIEGQLAAKVQHDTVKNVTRFNEMLDNLITD